MMSGGDPYAEWLRDKGFSGNSIIDQEGTMVSPIIDLAGYNRILSLCHYSPNKRVFAEINSEGEINNVWSGTSNNSRTINLTNSTRYLCRLCVPMDKVDDCFLKEQYTNTYIWWGKNITPPNSLIISVLCGLPVERRAA